MKKMIGFLIGLILLQALPLAEENINKKYDAQFSLAGGTVRGDFSLAGEFAYAREINGVFGQVSAMTNYNKGVGEHGFSLGVGTQGDEFQGYVFLDNLYREATLWSQLRFMFRLNYGWLNLGTSYYLPLQKTEIQLGTRGLRMANVWQADLSLIPFSWLRTYGNFYSVGNVGKKNLKFDVGVEIRPVKMISIQVDYNKSIINSANEENAEWNVYSNWFFPQDFRIKLNLLLGTRQKDFRQMSGKNIGPFIVRPAYPMLVVGESEISDPKNQPYQYYSTVKVYFKEDVSKVNPWKSSAMVLLKYQLYDPEMKDFTGDESVIGYFRFGSVYMDKIGDNYYCATLYHVCVQRFTYNERHAVSICDLKYWVGEYDTIDGIEIENSTEQEKSVGWLYFKMMKF